MNTNAYNLIKRGIDIVVSSGLLILFFPFWIIIPILIKLDSPGPIFYRHRRIGKDKQPFHMYKFRTMRADADTYLQNNPSLLKKFKQGDWKLENDPRITKLGRILRTVTIDEFPQLVNVLRGEMSMVGPRAYVAQELKEQPKKYPHTKPLIKEILSIKPGITGPWQTSGRNEIPFDKRASLDAQYARSRSITKDLIIILKTPQAMLSKW